MEEEDFTDFKLGMFNQGSPLQTGDDVKCLDEKKESNMMFQPKEDISFLSSIIACVNPASYLVDSTEYFPKCEIRLVEIGAIKASEIASKCK
jgi:hypothetical protein